MTREQKTILWPGNIIIINIGILTAIIVAQEIGIWLLLLLIYSLIGVLIIGKMGFGDRRTHYYM